LDANMRANEGLWYCGPWKQAVRRRTSALHRRVANSEPSTPIRRVGPVAFKYNSAHIIREAAPRQDTQEQSGLCRIKERPAEKTIKNNFRRSTVQKA
jgi:hypothetical protein